MPHFLINATVFNPGNVCVLSAVYRLCTLKTHCVQPAAWVQPGFSLLCNIEPFLTGTGSLTRLSLARNTLGTRGAYLDLTVEQDGAGGNTMDGSGIDLSV